MQAFLKVAYYTLGCKLNFAETSAIAKQLNEAGHARVDFEDRPDVFVINTCSVTDHADKKCRNIVRRAKRVNPHASVVVIGCYAQLKPQEIAAIPGVNLVLGANEKFDVVHHLEQAHQTAGVVRAAEIKHVRSFVPAFSSQDRTRSFLKVQDGCNYFCAFCTIPLARGRSRSASVAETVSRAKEAIAQGAKEIVLTGVNIGDFGHGSEEQLIDLLRELDELQGIARYRISSIEPNLLSSDIIAFLAQSRHFAPHLHLPLQSGSDRILAAMRRRYRTQLYRERVAELRASLPDCAIGADVITGFPGEEESDFNETYAFLQELSLAYLHVFTYSERPNTTAVRISSVVPLETRQLRTKQLRILSAKLQRAFYQSQGGREAYVLFEAGAEAGSMEGYTGNYIRVQVRYDSALTNELVRVRLPVDAFRSPVTVDVLKAPVYA